MRVKLFRNDPMTYTPFVQDIDFFTERGIEFTHSPRQCNLIVTRRYPSIAKRVKTILRSGFPRPILLWTHEPRFDNHFQSKIFGVPTIHIMNAYTGDVYLSNCSIYGPKIQHGLVRLLNEESAPDLSAPRQICFMGTYVDNPARHSFVVKGKDLNLTGVRQQLALEGHQQGIVDIYGKGWPKGISLEDSRKGEWANKWRDRKIEILENYNFNICLENTNCDFYCSEKIWDSIRGGCLPIYYGKNNRIYDDFPKDSFIDLAEFESFRSVFDFVENMKHEEYLSRLNKCIEVYNRWCDPEARRVEREKMLLKIVARIKTIARSGFF